MDAYLQFIAAAEVKDERTICRLISEHPELHNFEGVDGGLLDVIHYNCPELFRAAFAAGLSPDAGAPESHRPFLQQAVCSSDVDLVRLCLHHGADIERRNGEGETALGFAAAWGLLETVRLLVEAGADVNAVERAPDGYCSTALDAVFFSDERKEIRDYLRECGAKRYCELSPSGSS